MLSSCHDNVTAIATMVAFSGKKSTTDDWKGPKYTFALWKMENL